MRRALAVLAAALATPVAIAIAFACLALLRVGWFSDKDFGLVAWNVLLYSYFATPIALGVTLLAGLPIAVRLARRGRTRVRLFVLVGAALGVLPFLVFDGYVATRDVVTAYRHWPNDAFLGVRGTVQRLLGQAPTAMYWVTLGAWCGAWSSFAYWLVMHRGSPSNNALNPPHSAVTALANGSKRRAAGRAG